MQQHLLEPLQRQWRVHSINLRCHNTLELVEQAEGAATAGHSRSVVVPRITTLYEHGVCAPITWCDSFSYAGSCIVSCSSAW